MRPFRNPSNDVEVGQNFTYLVGLCQYEDPRDRALHDPEWNINAAWRFDDEAYYNNLPYREVVWPEDDARVAPRRRDRDRGGMEPNAVMLKVTPPLNLDKIEPGPEIPRDVKLPPFKVDYDTHEQVHQKLNGTIVLIKNLPFYVLQTAEQKGKFFLHVRGGEFDGHIAYDDIKDCRGIAPGYWMFRGNAYWIYRVPERQNSQGMCLRNTHHKQAGVKVVQASRTDFLQEALRVAKDMRYAPNLADVITGGGGNSIRLTNRVAIYHANKKGAPVGVEYCGRPMGLIVNGNYCKVSDPLDLGPSWIAKDLAQAGLYITE